MGAWSLEARGKAPSRRSLLAVGAALWTLAPRRLFAQERQPLPAKDFGPRLSIAVRIDGKGPFQFVVDTGAELSVIAAEVASELGLPVRERVLLHGMARSVPADTVQVNGLDIGQVHARGAELPVLPRAWMGADGYLGLDILDGHRVDFDFQRRTLTLALPRHHLLVPTIRRPDEAVVRADGAHGKLRAVDCVVDHVPVQAFVDTGAEVSVGNMALLAGLARRRPATAGQETIRITGITGGFVDCQRARLGSMALPGMQIQDFELAFADLNVFDLWGLAHRPALFIAMDMLRQFNDVVIDYGRSEYRFDVSAAGPWLRRT